jgi:putative ABC transport system substrate-binding protein
MERRRLALAAAAALTLPSLVLAQASKKVARIVHLSGLSADAANPGITLFRAGMRELGYAEGRNFVFDERYAAGQFERLAALAAELSRLKPDVYLVYGAEAAHAARAVSGALPIVLANTQDPVASGLVASLARPGGNITGLSDYHSATTGKRLALLKEALPRLSKVAVFWRPDHAGHPPSLNDLKAAAPALGITILPLQVRTVDDIDPAFAAIRKERAGALILLGDALITTHMKPIADLAIEHRVPAMYTARTFVHAGGFMGVTARTSRTCTGAPQPTSTKS